MKARLKHKGQFVSVKFESELRKVLLSKGIKNPMRKGKLIERAKEIVNKFYAKKIVKQETKTSPVNAVYENVKGYAERSRNTKIVIIRTGETKKEKVSLGEFEVYAASKNSDAWNKGKTLGIDGTVIPEIAFTLFTFLGTENVDKIEIDFNSIYPNEDD